jgi:LacI family transcriptional regulator
VRPTRRAPSERITLLGVAAAAGVSRATASLVLRGSPLVAEDTRARVLAAMHRLGYVPHRGAASLRTQRSGIVGLIIPDITNPFFAEMAVGIESEVDEAEKVVLLGNTAERLSKQDRLLETMHAHRADGMLLCPAEDTTPETLARLDSWFLPYVLFVRYVEGVAVDYVGADNIGGAQLAVEHLIEHGHRRIGFVGGPANASARHDRLRGYRRALERHDLPVDADLERTSPTSQQGGARAMRALLRLADPPTAVLCYNDVVAFGATFAVQAANLEVGRHIAIIGFDDISEAALWHPPLTTIAISPRRIGEEAARLLLERITLPERPPRQVILSPQLKVRDSCGSHEQEEQAL